MCLATDLALRNSGNETITCYKVLNKTTYLDFETKKQMRENFLKMKKTDIFPLVKSS
jgi:hypothetical protein